MKKNTLCFVLIFMILLILPSCGRYVPGRTNEIKELNENSNLEFMFSEDDKNLAGADRFERLEGFGGYALASKDSLTTYRIGGFPDCLDEYKVIGFQTENSKYQIYGISVGGKIEDAITVLESESYTKDKDNSNNNHLIYTKGKVSISISHDGQTISVLSVNLKVTNKKNVVF